MKSLIYLTSPAGSVQRFNGNFARIPRQQRGSQRVNFEILCRCLHGELPAQPGQRDSLVRNRTFVFLNDAWGACVLTSNAWISAAIFYETLRRTTTPYLLAMRIIFNENIRPVIRKLTLSKGQNYHVLGEARKWLKEIKIKIVRVSVSFRR